MRTNRINYSASLFALLLLSILLSSNLHAQTGTSIVKGVVQNNNSEPLPGVSVIIKNAKINFTSVSWKTFMQYIFK